VAAAAAPHLPSHWVGPRTRWKTMQGLFLLPELETTLAIVQKSNEPLRRMVAAPATTLPPFQLRQPSRQRPQLLFLLTTTTHVHTAHLAQMPSDAQPIPSCTRLLRTTPSGRAPHSTRTCCSCYMRYRRSTRAGTARRISGSACSVARQTCVTARFSVRGSVRCTTR
jgi:hypothetical protein